MMKVIQALILIAILGLGTGCSQEPVEIHYGSDECAHCRMVIADERFAAQAITSTGKAIKFDAIECMAAYASEHKGSLQETAFWLSDFRVTASWIPAEQAFIVRSNSIKSPMGAGLLAIGSDEEGLKHLDQYLGEQVTWEKLVR